MHETMLRSGRKRGRRPEQGVRASEVARRADEPTSVAFEPLPEQEIALRDNIVARSSDVFEQDGAVTDDDEGILAEVLNLH